MIRMVIRKVFLFKIALELLNGCAISNLSQNIHFPEVQGFLRPKCSISKAGGPFASQWNLFCVNQPLRKIDFIHR